MNKKDFNDIIIEFVLKNYKIKKLKFKNKFKRGVYIDGYGKIEYSKENIPIIKNKISNLLTLFFAIDKETAEKIISNHFNN